MGFNELDEMRPDLKTTLRGLRQQSWDKCGAGALNINEIGRVWDLTDWDWGSCARDRTGNEESALRVHRGSYGYIEGLHCQSGNNRLRSDASPEADQRELRPQSTPQRLSFHM